MLDRVTVRTHAGAVALISWALVAWTQFVPGPADRFGTLRGVDFLQFYTAGLLVARGDGASLYDWDLFTRAVRAVAPPHAGDVLFLPVYPPQVALLFAPVAPLPYLPALAVWVAVSAALYAGAAWLLWRSLPSLRPYRREAVLLAIAFPPFVQLLAHGQIAAVALVVLVVGWRAWAGGSPFWTGFALGSLAFKPQLGLFAAMALVLMPSLRLLAGVIAAVLAQLGVVLLALGPEVILDYAHTVVRVLGMPAAFEPKPWQMHSLPGAVVLLLGRSPLATGVAIAGAAFTIWIAWQAARRSPAPQVRFATVALAALVVNPHLYVYDLVLLAVPLACIAAWLVSAPIAAATPRIAWVAYGLVWLPLVGPLAEVTRVQLTAPAMILLLWLLRAAPALATADPRTRAATHPA